MYTASYIPRDYSAATCCELSRSHLLSFVQMVSHKTTLSKNTRTLPVSICSACAIRKKHPRTPYTRTVYPATKAEEREAAAQLSREVADGNTQAGGNAISARDLNDGRRWAKQRTGRVQGAAPPRTQGGIETAPHGWAEKGRAAENAPIWALGQRVGLLHGGTILSYREHSAEGSKAVESHGKTAEAGKKTRMMMKKDGAPKRRGSPNRRFLAELNGFTQNSISEWEFSFRAPPKCTYD